MWMPFSNIIVSPDTRIKCDNLADLGIANLSRELDKVVADHRSIVNLTRELAFDNYKTFIETAERSNEISVEFIELERRLKQIDNGDLTNFNEACHSFQNRTKNLQSSRRLNSLLLSKHTRLIEFLELPQLAEMCVRNGHFNEALDLFGFATRLKHKIGSHIPLVAQISTEVLASQPLMQKLLLEELSGQISLSSCLQVVGYLRRLINDVSDTELGLRFSFLQARQIWLESTILTAQEKSGQESEKILRVMDINRSGIFDIVMQYRAVFGTDDDCEATCRRLFSTWLLRRVNILVESLENGIQQLLNLPSLQDSAVLESVLIQAMYVGQSLSRAGGDFRQLLTPIFVRAARKLALASLEGTEESFKADLAKMKENNLELINSADEVTETYKGSIEAPLILLKFPPLANLTNAILRSLNQMRLCSPFCLIFEIGCERIMNILISVRDSIILHQNQNIEPALSSSGSMSLARCFANYMVPHISHCFKTVYPPDACAKLISQQKAAFSYDQKIVAIDVELLTACFLEASITSKVVEKDVNEEDQIDAHSENSKE